MPLGQLRCRGEGRAEAGLDLAAEGVDAELLEHVLEPGALAVLPVAEVAEGEDDGLGQVLDAVRGHPAQRVGQAGEGVVRPGVAGAQAAAHQHGEALGAVGARHGHEAEVVAVDVDAVVAGPGQPDLELPGQVGGAVERLLLVGGGLGRDGLLAVDPDLVVRAGPGPEADGQALGEVQEHLLPAVGHRGRAGHDVAHDVAARGERGDQVLVEGADQRAQAALAHEVELHAASRGQPDGAVGDHVGHVVDGPPLVRRQRPAGHAGPDHEDVVRLLARAGPLPADVPVVLLVHPVELEQVAAVLREGWTAAGQLVGQRTPQTPAGGLHILDRRHEGERSPKPDLINQILGD